MFMRTLQLASARDPGLNIASVAADMTSFELQQSIERFTGHFIDSVTDALHDELQSDKTKVFRASVNRLLLYCSSALDIATGPIPEVNTVDMAVFLTLSRTAIETHWMPNVFGGDGRALLNAFVSAEHELREISDTFMSASQQQELNELIRDWLAENPGRVSVEWVRFQDFVRIASDIESARAKRARGLLGSVKSATQKADQAMLLAERALFLSHRLPFLLRLHVRLCVPETLTDSLRTLQDGVLRRWFVYVFLLGASWALVFWCGYYFAHQAVAP
ncbi:MAG TPA: hypothetical protein VFG30_37285 [Polyangiales bacterium]|nr:hypothetical protein [Polyangiales bacterium]